MLLNNHWQYVPYHSNKNVGTFGSLFDHRGNLKKILWLTSYGDVTIVAAGTADENMKPIKYEVDHFPKRNIWLKLVAFSLKFNNCLQIF